MSAVVGGNNQGSPDPPVKLSSFAQHATLGVAVPARQAGQAVLSVVKNLQTSTRCRSGPRRRRAKRGTEQ
eukprot:620557-Alexandrium_andersonii.AAC.1